MLMGRLYPYYRFLRDFSQYIWHEKHKRKHFLTLRQLFGRTSFSSSFINFYSALLKYRLFSANLCRELLYTDWPLWGRKLVKLAQFLTTPNPWSICKGLLALLSLPVSTRLLLSCLHLWWLCQGNGEVWFPKWVFTQRNEIHTCLNINISQQRVSAYVGGEGIDAGSGNSASRCLWEMSIICHWNLMKQDGEMGKCSKASGVMGLNYDNSPQGRWRITYDPLSMAKKNVCSIHRVSDLIFPLRNVSGAVDRAAVEQNYQTGKTQVLLSLDSIFKPRRQWQ